MYSEDAKTNLEENCKSNGILSTIRQHNLNLFYFLLSSLAWARVDLSSLGLHIVDYSYRPNDSTTEQCKGLFSEEELVRITILGICYWLAVSCNIVQSKLAQNVSFAFLLRGLVTYLRHIVTFFGMFLNNNTRRVVLAVIPR